ncbi:MAG: bifunctional glutamate--cysteine ligase GshA/glutathione synthetase GshB [Defluviitaleaceae bacterium]|nr:bifunctional glutamate--cysteine ligase GshA/glutathione synthetase GshB [Defluviitaleaceae bacterium]
MLINNKAVLNKIDLLHGRFGLEREALRMTPEGTVAQTDHPVAFGNRTKHPYIVTDFAEAQVEMITGVHETLEGVHRELVMINQIVARTIGNELLWPYSMPPEVDWNEVRIAEYPNNEVGNAARTYREYLNQKYGNGVQLISGIHYNFSYHERLIEKLYEVSDQEVAYKTFKNAFYMKVAKKYLTYHWFLVYMLGRTPVAPGIDEPHAISLRNSKYGYQNKVALGLSYESLCEHIDSVRTAMAEGKVIDEREIYAPVRIKCPNQIKLLNCLEENGIGYLEIRSIDLNPLAFEGITLEDLKFVHLFMLTLLELDEVVDFNPEELANDVALEGAKANEAVVERVTLILDKMEALNKAYDLGLNTAVDLLKQNRGMRDLDLMSLAHQHKENALVNPYRTYGFEDMEMSTQLMIAEAVRRGVKYSVLDRLANFLCFEANGKREYVKQATKTSLDTYVSYLAMENKEVTKIILDDAGFPVPKGRTFTSVDDALLSFHDFKGQEVVVKPKSTNFGWGIVMFKPLVLEAEFQNALEIAFGFDTEVIVEQFLHGQEYRFLVIGEACIAVLKRVGANVVGDGISTVAELVAKKNEHPWRGTDHLAPLEKIVLGDIELHNLKQAGYTPDSVLQKDVRVFLRDNSNISTGGDSIDVTDEAHEFFKRQAVAAAHAIGARVCGVDMMINGELSDDSASYGFIELNFNPAIHMHAFTLEGKGRNAAPHVLDQLGLL